MTYSVIILGGIFLGSALCLMGSSRNISKQSVKHETNKRVIASVVREGSRSWYISTNVGVYFDLKGIESEYVEQKVRDRMYELGYSNIKLDVYY